MPSFLISGATRGIGLALVERLAQDESRIIYAGARNLEKAAALKELEAKSNGRIIVVQLDPTSQESVDAAIKFVEEKQGSLDVLINNAGTMAGDWQDVLHINYADLQTNFDVNVIGVARLTDAALPLLRKGSTRHVYVVSSIVGASWFWQHFGTAMAAAYAPTKAAATHLATHYAMALKSEDFMVKAIHPGWVKTELGGPDAQITVEESINGISKLIESSSKEDAIALYNYDGSVLPF